MVAMVIFIQLLFWITMAAILIYAIINRLEERDKENFDKRDN